MLLDEVLQGHTPSKPPNRAALEGRQAILTFTLVKDPEIPARWTTQMAGRRSEAVYEAGLTGPPSLLASGLAM